MLQEIYTYEKVSNDKNVVLFDSDEDLELFCYQECDNNSSDFLQNCRGLIFKNKKLFLKSYPYTQEYELGDPTYESCLENLDEWSFEPSYEGALLRLFFNNGKWILSTHKKLNAFKSRWSSYESFGNIFRKAVEKESKINPNFKLNTESNILGNFYKMLNEKYQYMFLLRNNKENRLVCEGTSDDENSIFHVGTMHNLNFVEHDLGLKVPERFEFKSIDELNDFVYNKVDHTKTQGIFCYNKTKNVQLKILHPEYFKLYQIRGNQSSLKFRYLQLRNDEEKLKSFLELYSDKKQDFQEYENIISHITQTLFDTYFAKYINKKYIRLNSRDYNILKECHNWHVQDRKNNRISLAKVSQVLNEQTPTCINHMIKRYKKELYDTQKENYETPVQLE